MRLVEWIYIIFNVVMLVGLVVNPRNFRRVVWGGFAISTVLLLLHGWMEGLRWPMIPGYAMTFIPILLLIVTRGKQRSSEPWSRLRAAATSLFVLVYAAVTVGLPLLFPIFTFAEPAGSYGIGTVSYDWTDETREELFTTQTGDHRELMVQVWYPTNKDVKGAPVPYVSDSAVYSTAFNEVLKLPKMLFSSLGDVKTHAIHDAMLSDAEAKYPILIFSHGLHGYEKQNTFQVEQLVSQGYIVVGINHTYSSLVSIFQDGRVAQFESEGKEGFDQLQFDYMDKLNETWVKDAQFVLDQIEKLAASDPEGRFTGHMDLERIGMFGHSFGGATTVQVLMDDPRVQAGINMDGVLFGEKRIPAQGVGKPFLMMSADETLAGTSVMDDDAIAALGATRPEADMYYEEVYARYEPVTAGGNYWMTLNNTKHLSFSDIYLISPILEWSQGVDARGTQELVNEATLDFFNHVLKGEPLKLLNGEAGDHPAYSLQKG